MPYFDQARSLGHLFQLSCQHWGDKTALLVGSDRGRTPVSYSELYREAYRYAAALASYGVQRGDKVCIFSENCPEWALTDWGAHTLGVCLVPIYPSLPGDQAEYIIRDCGAKLVIVGSEELRKKLDGLTAVPMTMLKGDADSIESKLADPGLTFEAWEQGIALPTLDDQATIIYTSGTTGDPKGAVLPNRAFVEMVRSVKKGMPVSENDTFLSFLPLSHVYERADGHIMPICIGATIGYVRSLATISADFLEVRPTVMLIVPRFLESLKDKILDGLKKAPPVRQKLFHLALAQGTARLNGGFAPLAGLTNKVVAAKIRDRVGGRLRYFCSGGMALPMHIHEFFGAFGLPVLQGYGLTETCSGMCFNQIERNRPHTVGEALPGVEIKIADDGEILIRSPFNMSGYYNLPEATSAAIDAEGWFHTGDIGEFEDKTFLKITDRKKDILVLGNGKNVAPQRIEDRLRGSKYIAEAVLFGDSQSYVAGLIVPNFENLESFCKSLGLKIDEPERMLQLDPIRKLIKDEIAAVNKTLADFEKVKNFELINAKFSIETGELTPSLKVKRKVIKERYSDLITGLFR
jgi:long-chain acyl-CoA synthetase